MTAEAAAINSTVTNVEFFANGTSIGRATNAPFTITWSNVAKGGFQLTAIVRNAQDDTGNSQLVDIKVIDDVSQGFKRVAIVQNSFGPEISKLQAWLSDLDLCSYVFNRAGLTYEALKEYDLVI